MRICIATIPNSEQRYPTAGDYWIDENGDWQIRVSQLGDWRFELLVAIHELCEMAMCHHDGIPESEITAFDIQYEKDREAGKHCDYEEPGDDFESPYGKQHCLATGIERIMCAVLDVEWSEYEESIP
jgi:hypothetical protein